MELLRTFVLAVETGSFTRAGAQVGRTQSAISQQIQRLEQVVELHLFQREGHRLQLTEEGKALAQYARRILALNDEALTSLKRPKVTGRVRFGAPHEYTASLLPEFLGKFAQSHPDVMLEVTSDLSQNLLRRQRQGEFDLVIALHDEADKPGGHKIFTEPLTWISGVDRARHEQRPVPLVVAPQPCIYRYRMLQTLKQLQVPCRVVYLSSSYNGITAAVMAGLGVTVMASSTIPVGVRKLSVRDGLPSLGKLEVRLHRASDTASDAVARLEEFIEGSFAQSGKAWTENGQTSRMSE